jgi:hypothetical protein
VESESQTLKMFAFRSVTAITILGVIVIIIGEVLTPPTAGAEW